MKRKALGCLARPFLGVPLARQTEAFMLPLLRPQTWGPGPALAAQHLLKEKPRFSWCKASTAACSGDVTEAQPGGGQWQAGPWPLPGCSTCRGPWALQDKRMLWLGGG